MAEFIADIDIKDIQGVGSETARKIENLKLGKTCRDLQRIGLIDMIRLFGSYGEKLYYFVRGVDDRPVEANREIKSLGTEDTFSEDLYTEDEILDNIDRLREGGFLMGQGSIVNTDGDVIRWAMTGQDGKPFTYRYYKPISEDYYLHLNVYVTDGTTFKPGDTLEKYLILTNDCYYIMDDSIQYEAN